MSEIKDIQNDSRIVAKDMLKVHKSGAISIREEHRGDVEWFMMKKFEKANGEIVYVLEPETME